MNPSPSCLQSATPGNASTEGQISSQFQAIGNIFDAIITACSLALVIWYISPLSALISVLVPIPTILAYGWYGRQESIFWPQASQCSRRHLYLQDQISYQATGAELAAMKASGRIAALSNRSKNEYLKIREYMEHLSILSNSLCGFATTALFVLALWFLYRDSAHDVSIVFSGIVGLMSGITAMCGIGYQVGELLTSIPANTHLRKFLESAVQSPEYYRPATLDSLEACNLSVFYGRLQAVKDVSLTVSKGQLCALVGENGSGKTSLIKAMMGLQKHASGQLRLGELTLSLENLHALYPFATVQQDYGRYEISVREFLTLGIPQERQTEENIWHALMFSEADSFVKDLPEKLETQLGTQWGGVNLSGGQWQRLAISRAVLSDAPIWFLDEPTSAVDAPTEERIFNRLVEESRNRIIILSSHRVSTLQSIPQILVLQKGHIVETGSYAELISSNTEFYQMFQSQMLPQPTHQDQVP